MLQNQKELLSLKRKMNALLILFGLLAILGLLSFFNLSPIKLASALNPTNYQKAEGDQLTQDDWNRLPSDFVDQSGDEMTGALSINGGSDNGELKLKSTVNGSNFWSLFSHKNYGDLNLAYGGSSKIIVDNDSGNIGVGGSPDQDKLSVFGKLKVTGTVQAAEPTSPTELTTKSYVDNSRAWKGCYWKNVGIGANVSGSLQCNDQNDIITDYGCHSGILSWDGYAGAGDSIVCLVENDKLYYGTLNPKSISSPTVNGSQIIYSANIMCCPK